MNETKEYLKFDTVKFVTSSQYFKMINREFFKHDVDPTTGEFKSVEFNSRRHQDIIPFELYILVNYQSGKMYIEFSSKLLLEDYPKLISIETFKQCLQNIEKLGICTLNINGIMENSYFNKLHITKDVELKLDSKILGRLNLCTGDYRRYKWDRYLDNAILFTKNVKSNDCKEAMSIYDKELEIQLSRNKTFLELTGNAEGIKEYFKNKTRFEVRFDNKRKIQKEFGIKDTSVRIILSMDRNIILNQYDKIFTNSTKKTDTKLKINGILEYGILNILRFYNGDMQKIEQEIKDLGFYGSSSRGAMGRQIRKIKEMKWTLINQEEIPDDTITKIRNLLNE